MEKIEHNDDLHDFKMDDDEARKEKEKVGKIELIASGPYGLVEKKILSLGTGRRPKRGQEMTMEFTGYLEAQRKKYYSTYDGEDPEPYTFAVGIQREIKGWDLGCLSMREGEKAELSIFGNFGYGMDGYPKWKIPAMANLIMEIEILSIGDEIHVPSQNELDKMRIKKKMDYVDRSNEQELTYNGVEWVTVQRDKWKHFNWYYYL